MERIKINKESLKIFKEIHSIKKPKEINPLLDKAVEITHSHEVVEDQEK